jgi:replicative DNA helicase
VPRDGDAPTSIFRPFEGPASPPGQRLPPQNVQAEQSLLGALLANNKAYDRVQFLEPHHFADPINGRIFEEIRRLIGEKRVADPVTLKTVFEHSGILKDVGGTAYLVSLLSAMVGLINAGDYANVVRETWLRRELIDIGEILVNEAHGSGIDAVDPAKVAMEAVSMIDKVVLGIGAMRDSNTTLAQAMADAEAAMWEAQESGKPPGLSTGFRCFDRRLGGLEGGLTYVLGGRPGSGKSSLGLRMMLNAAENDIGVLALSQEMTAKQLGRRTLACESGVPLAAIRFGQVTREQADKVVAARIALSKRRITIDDATGQTRQMIAAKVRSAKRKHGLGLVVLDHLNLTRADDVDAKHGPTYAIGQAMHTMLQVAKDEDVPVIVLVQLSRGPENREDHRPNLADLRQSGHIEEDAYAVGFVYRPEYYMNKPPEPKESEAPDRFRDRHDAWSARLASATGRAEIIWEKNRDGETGIDNIMWNGETTNFYEEWG